MDQSPPLRTNQFSLRTLLAVMAGICVAMAIGRSLGYVRFLEAVLYGALLGGTVGVAIAAWTEQLQKDGENRLVKKWGCYGIIVAVALRIAIPNDVVFAVAIWSLIGIALCASVGVLLLVLVGKNR